MFGWFSVGTSYCGRYVFCQLFIIKRNSVLLRFTHDSGHYFTFDGADIYYEILGNPNGKPLVLLHGGLGCMTDFNSVIDSIPEDYMI
ncbi:alpha/beta fold hydrolase, partial [Photobacterium lipolyticum]|uniref:alpha/beta fold hydrolase n=1 Tax=Photobacterium lipolyticum TaxID=266810 RepID=UPI003CCC2EED